MISLSIVTVTKNCAQTISRTLDSVRAVKRSNIEYVIVDGVSTDGTLEVIRSYGELVDVIHSEPDSGIYNAMNKAVRLARGRFVLFINGDDALVPDGFPKILSELDSEKSEIICGTTLVGNLTDPDEVLIAKPWLLFFFNSIPHPSAFVKRTLLLSNPFREDLRIVSDYDFFLRAFLSVHKFRVVPVVTALHNRSGASSNVQQSVQELELVRRQRLHLVYPILNCVCVIYRLGKRVLNRFVP